MQLYHSITILLDYPPLRHQNLRRLHDHFYYNKAQYPTPLERLPFIQIFTRRYVYATVESVPATYSTTSTLSSMCLYQSIQCALASVAYASVGSVCACGLCGDSTPVPHGVIPNKHRKGRTRNQKKHKIGVDKKSVFYLVVTLSETNPSVFVLVTIRAFNSFFILTH